MAGGEISRAKKNSKKKFKAREKAEEEARQKEQLIEYFKWYIPFHAPVYCQNLKVIAESVNFHGGEQLKNLAKLFLEGEITERSVILELAERRAKEYGILLDFENYGPNSPYPTPVNNPYFRTSDDEKEYYDSEEWSE